MGDWAADSLWDLSTSLPTFHWGWTSSFVSHTATTTTQPSSRLRHILYPSSPWLQLTETGKEIKMEKDNAVWKVPTWQCHHLIQQGCSLHCSQLGAGSTILFSSASPGEPTAPLDPILGLQESSFPRLGDMVWHPLLLSMPKPVPFHTPRRYYRIAQEIWRRALSKLSSALLNHRKTTDLKPSLVMLTEMLFWMNLTSKIHINMWAKWCRKEWFRHKGGCAVCSGLFFLVFVVT